MMREQEAAQPSRVPGLIGLALIGFVGLMAAIMAFRLGLWRQGSPGEGLFPFIVASGIVVFGVLSMLAPHVPSEDMRAVDRPSLLRVGAYLIALVFYATSLEALGFVVATAIAVVFILRFAERYSWRMVAALTVGTIVFCQILFVRWLGAQLPTGFLWESLFG
jgi:hypothetical protein